MFKILYKCIQIMNGPWTFLRNDRLIVTGKKNLLIILLLFSFLVNSSLTFAQGPSAGSRTPRVALVLSGGGAKGFAHIGVLKVLEEEGIPVDMIVGTSIGGIVGGFYSIGYTASELEEIVKSMNWENVLSDDVQRSFLSKHDQLLQQRYFLSLKISDKRKLSLPQGLLRGYNVLNTFCGLAGNVPVNADFSSFPVPFACIAVDLQTGREVILDKGFLPTALYSSMAIPVVFQPSSRDGAMLLDGGIKNNFPADVAKKMGADIIIGVDIRLDYFDNKELPTINNVLGRVASFSNLEMDSVKRTYCNLIIRPDLKGYNMSSFSRTAADTLIQRGREAAERSREQLRTLKAAFDLRYHQISRQYVNPEKWYITALQFSGDSYLAEHYMEHILNMDIPGEYTREEIKSAIDRLYGLGGFEYIYFNLLGNSEGKVLNLNLMTSKSTNLNLGFRTNTTDNSAILLNVTSKNFSNIFGLFSADLELSANPELSFTTELNQRNLPAVGITISGKRQKYGIYNYGNKLSETSMFYARAGFYTYQPFLKNFSLGAGIMEEYYRMNNLSFGENMPFPGGKDDFAITNLYSFISYDNMDEYYFPHKGTEFYSELSLLTDLKRNSEVYFNFLLRNRNVVTLTSKMTLLLDLYSRIEFNPGVPQPKNTMIGGESYSQYFNYHFPFLGLPVVNVAGQYSYLGLAGLRFELPRSQYLSVIFNGLLHGSEFIPWDNNFIPGCGVRYSLKSILGPLDTSVGYSFKSGKPVFSAGFGFWF